MLQNNWEGIFTQFSLNFHSLYIPSKLPKISPAASKKRSPVSPKSFLRRGKNCHTPQPVLAGGIEVLGGWFIPPMPPRPCLPRVHVSIEQNPIVSFFPKQLFFTQYKLRCKTIHLVNEQTASLISAKLSAVQ
jgi:hypothetical protein